MVSRTKKGKKQAGLNIVQEPRSGPSRTNRSRKAVELPEDPIESCDEDDDYTTDQQVYAPVDAEEQDDDDVVCTGTVIRKQWTPPVNDDDFEVVEISSSHNIILAEDMSKACLAELLAHREKVSN